MCVCLCVRQLAKLTIPQLKEICRSAKVSTTGVKAVLVNTITQAFAQ